MMFVAAIAAVCLPEAALPRFVVPLALGIGSGAAMIPFTMIKEANPRLTLLDTCEHPSDNGCYSLGFGIDQQSVSRSRLSIGRRRTHRHARRVWQWLVPLIRLDRTTRPRSPDQRRCGDRRGLEPTTRPAGAPRLASLPK
jgi:hypothetical protein